MYIINSGSECMKNPFTTYRLTKAHRMICGLPSERSITACMSRQPAVLSVLSLCRLHTHSKRRGNPGKPPACRLLMWNNWEHWGFSTIDVCQIIHRPKWCTPPPHYIFKNVPQFLPTPSPLTTALPSCFHFNTRAPSKKGRHLAHAFEDKK